MAPGKGTSGKLPSEEVYDKFERSKACPNEGEYENYRGQMEDVIRPVLQKEHINKGNLTTEIAEGWCNAYKIKTEERPQDYRPGHFFYYWLGNKIKEKLPENGDFPKVIREIYSKLPKDKETEQSIFGILYGDIIWHTFQNRKKLFDYDYDYKKLKQQPQEGDSCPWKEKLYEKWTEAIKAHEDLFKACAEDDPSKYCYGFRKTNTRERTHPKPQDLTCTTKREEEDEGDEEGEEDDLVEEEELLLDDNLLEDEEEGNNLGNLPSRGIYTQLQQGTVCSKKISNEEEIKQMLRSHGVEASTVDKIISSLCYISTLGSDRDKQVKYCKFVYYWVGEELSKIPGVTKFQEAMKGCKDKIYDSESEHKCEFLYTPEEKKVFKASKIMFDYYTDRDSIEENLMSKDRDCTNPYYKYLQKAQYAYRTIRRSCNGNDSDQWCEQFKSMYGECRSTGKVKASQCKVENTPGIPCWGDSRWEAVILPPEDGVTSPGSNATTTAAASSAIGLVGLPLFAFFSYKYNLLPSWISNTIFGNNNNRRKKRSTGRQNIDELTETSTIGPGENDSTYDSATDTSTIGDLSTTTDASTIYNSNLNRRGGTSNNRRGKQQPQRQQSHRNIGYQNM
ncbi:Kir-like protein [Plasmodium coatneyi]|uniref:Kir-like protein n=1 Tax=Plasmodium coatneyi TaxID=208452 RepID=A0A1B1DYJ9_9APIC|nr:Kir-like protein [Plasmodium coatneyi]ANQ07872.1 Kir-like protein [Plasmodium coatneyi]